MKYPGLKLKLQKCKFLKEERKYLGFVINKKGTKLDLEKVEVIRFILEPKSVKEVRGFIGDMGYYGDFSPDSPDL